MEQVEVVMSSANQITVPSQLRKMLGLKAGDKLAFHLGDKAITITKAESDEEKTRRIFRQLDEWRESLPEEVKENIKKHAGWTANQYHEHYDNTPEHKAYIKEKYGI